MTNDGWGKLPTNTDWNIPWTTPVNTQSAPATEVWPASKVTKEEYHARADKEAEQWGSDETESNFSMALKTILAPGFGEHTPTATEIKIADQNKIPVEWPKSDGWGKSDWSLPDINGDSWGNAYPPRDTVEPEAVEDLITPSRAAIEAAQETNATLSRQTDVEQRASVLNSLSGKRDEWVMETDGELNKREEVIPTVTSNVPTGFYIAYHTGKWLHAVLSGPYPDKGAAIVMADAAYARMTEDSVFKLAFENKFERNGIYIAEIPMSARRHGAYGVLA